MDCYPRGDFPLIHRSGFFSCNLVERNTKEAAAPIANGEELPKFSLAYYIFWRLLYEYSTPASDESAPRGGAAKCITQLPLTQYPYRNKTEILTEHPWPTQQSTAVPLP